METVIVLPDRSPLAFVMIQQLCDWVFNRRCFDSVLLYIISTLRCPMQVQALQQLITHPRSPTVCLKSD